MPARWISHQPAFKKLILLENVSFVIFCPFLLIISLVLLIVQLLIIRLPSILMLGVRLLGTLIFYS